MTFMNKVALVTGGGRGIGKSVCLELASRGAAVIINYSGSESAALETKAEIERQKGKAEIIKCDVRDFESCRQMFDQAAKVFGPVEILINNAGITKDNLILRMDTEDFLSVLNVNLVGAFNCTKLAVKPMMKKRWGRIVNIGSVVGLTGNAGQANYAASKAGVIALTKSTAKEFASRGITVNAVAPGFIETDMTASLSEDVRQKLLENIPAKRLGSTEDISKTIGFLCSDEAAYITGQTLAVDGGMTMV